MPQYFRKLPTTNQPWSTLGNAQSIQCDERSVWCDCEGAQLAIAILAPNLIRVRLAPTGEFRPRRSWAVALDDGE